jgi:hypothetical protein
MRSMLHRVAGAVMAAALAIPMLVSPPTVQAQPVDTTAVVLRVVDGDTIDIRDESVAAFACGSWELIRLKRKSPAIPSAAGDPRRRSSRSQPWRGNEWHSNPTRRKTGPTVMAAPWRTLSGRTAGTIRSKRLARERPTPTCTAAIPLLATLQSRRQSKRQLTRIGVFGVRRAMATRNQFRAEVGAAELTPNTRRTLCFSWLHDTETRPAPRLTLPQCSRRRATR